MDAGGSGLVGQGLHNVMHTRQTVYDWMGNIQALRAEDVALVFSFAISSK